jgi:ABC-type transporter Mla subunit MlaD
MISELKKNIDNDENKLQSHLDFLDYVPNFFISYGIFGTFLGIVIGLSSLKFSKVEELEITIPSLVNSMYLAFISSLIGIALSLTYRRLPFIIKLYNNINQKLLESENLYNEDLITSVNNVKKEIANLGQTSFSQVSTTLSVEVQGFVQKLENNTISIIKEIAYTFSQINEAIKNSYNYVNDSLSALRQNMNAIEENQKQLKLQFDHINSIAENIKNIMQNLQEVTSEQNNLTNNQKEILLKIENVYDNLSEIVTISNNLAGILNGTINSIKELPSFINDFYENNKQIIDQYPYVLKNNINQSFSDLDQYIADLTGSFKNISEIVNDSVTNFSQKINENINILTKIINEFNNKLNNKIFYENNTESSFDNIK